MRWFERQIGNLEAWWVKASINQKAWAGFGVLLVAAVIVAAL